MKLFFSYGHDKNEKIVLRLKKDIERRNHSVWIDKSQIKSGDDWRRTITSGILESEFIMFFASNYSVRNPGVCLDELMIAVSVKGAQVQTVLLEPNVIPPANIGYRQYIDMSKWSTMIRTNNFEAWYKDKLNEIINIIESPETVQYAKEMEFLKEQLQPNLTSAKKDRLWQEYFCGREWLTQKVRDWLCDNDVSRILLIDGSPGIGKSSFMAHEFMFNESVGAIFFCEWDNPESNNLDAISRCMVFQLASKLTDYRGQVVKYLRMIQRSKEKLRDLESDGGIFRFLLLKQLRNLIDGQRPVILLLIDGIDELEEKNDGGRKRNVFAEILRQEINDFPRWIRFVITSRCDSRVIMPLKNVTSIHMDQFVTDNVRDIKQYIKHEMIENISEEIIKKISDKCEGNFLYAKMVVGALKIGKLSLNDVLKGETGDLGFIYRRYFDRTFLSINEYEKVYYSAIAALAVTEERIPKATFTKITGWSTRQQNQYVKVMSPFLTSGREYLGLYHKSLQDWLLSESADDYMVDAFDGIKKICDGCIQAYQESMNEMNKYELKYLIPYMEKTQDQIIWQVLKNKEYADLLMKHARMEAIAFRYDDATSLAEMAWYIYKNNHHFEDVALAGLFLAEVTDLMVCLEKSKKWCKDSLEVIKGDSSLIRTTLFGDIWMKLAYVYFREGNWEKSVHGYKIAYEYYNKSKNVSENQREQKKIEAMMMCANALRNSTDYKEAIKLFQKIETSFIYEKLKKTEVILYTNILLHYGWTLHNAGNYRRAGEYLEQAERMLANTDLPLKDIAQVYYLRSVEWFNQADYSLAEKYCEKSLYYVKQVYGENAVEVCSALNQLGAIVQKCGNYIKAIQIFKKSYEIRLNYYGENNLFTTISLRNYGKALLKKESDADLEMVGNILEKVKSIREKIAESGKGLGWLAQIYLDLADYYRITLNYKEAEIYVLKSIDLYKKYGSKRDISTCEMQIGMIKYDSGDYENAKKAFIKAIDFNKKCYNPRHPYAKELQMWYEKVNKKLKN